MVLSVKLFNVFCDLATKVFYCASFTVTMAKNLIDRISVESPCSESWDEMTGNANVRFCSHCSKDVHNLSEITRKQAEALIKRSNGKLCVRYRADQNGRVINQPPMLTKITRRATVAAGVLAASLAAGTAVYAQGDARFSKADPLTEKTVAVKENKSSKNAASISGVVMDEKKAVILDAKVLLFRISNDDERVKVAETVPFASGSLTGQFFFKDTEVGDYELVFLSPGFEQLKKQIKLENDVEIKIVATLIVGWLMGEIIIIEDTKIKMDDYDKPLF